MKKAKKNTGSSAKTRSRVLIPLLSGRENNKGFIAQAVSGVDEAILIITIDTASMPGVGFAASEIGKGNELMQEIKEAVEEMGIECSDVEEWGNTETKIINFVKLRRIGKVALAKQDNEFFKNIAKRLREETETEVQVIEIKTGE